MHADTCVVSPQEFPQKVFFVSMSTVRLSLGREGLVQGATSIVVTLPLDTSILEIVSEGVGLHVIKQPDCRHGVGINEKLCQHSMGEDKEDRQQGSTAKSGSTELPSWGSNYSYRCTILNQPIE